MNSHIDIQTAPALSLSGEFPKEFSDDWLPGTKTLGATGSIGQLGIQTVTVNGITMHYIVAGLSDELRIKITGANSFVFIQVLLEGTYETNVDFLQQHLPDQHHYSFVSPLDKIIHLVLPEQERLKMLAVSYPLSFIQSLIRYHPALEELQEKLMANKEPVVFNNTISPLLAERIYALLHTPFTPSTEEYFRWLFKEMLQIIFSEYVPEKRIQPFNLHDVSCIHFIKEYIDTHLLEHLTIAQLSRKAGINQLKLKKGFKAIYGSGVYGYQLEQRMLIAKTSLEKTWKPIHQVARQSGYKNTANFSAAFKKVYGISPFRYRSQTRKK